MKSVFVLVVLFFIGFYTVNAQECSAQTCFNCTAQTGCGWCGPTLSCLPGNASGPSHGSCVGKSWQFEKCFHCSGLKTCRSCFERDAECFWTPILGACVPLEFSKNYPIPPNKQCNCTGFSDCSDCRSQSNCVWCVDDNNPTCKDGITGNCSNKMTNPLAIIIGTFTLVNKIVRINVFGAIILSSV